MPAENGKPPDAIAETHAPRALAAEVWWTRVRRAAERRGNAGSKLLSDWVRDLLPVRSPDACELAQWDRLEPAAVAERFTDEYKAREERRLCDELGVALGVGPMP